MANTKVADFGTVWEDVREKVDSDLGTDVTGNQVVYVVVRVPRQISRRTCSEVLLRAPTLRSRTA